MCGKVAKENLLKTKLSCDKKHSPGILEILVSQHRFFMLKIFISIPKNIGL